MALTFIYIFVTANNTFFHCSQFPI